jgi:hypothetical protein
MVEKTETGASEVSVEEGDPILTHLLWVRCSEDGTKEGAILKAMPTTKVKIKVGAHFADGENVEVTVSDNTGGEEKLDDFKVSVTINGNFGISEEIDVLNEWLDKKLKLKIVSQVPFNSEFDGTELLIIPIEFVEIKVQLLDCRAGTPIVNAKLKKIVVKSGDTEKFKEEFARDGKNIDHTKDFVKNSMEVFKALDSSIKDATADNYNDVWRSRYNTYWNNRVSSNFSNLTTGNPPESMLKHIIEHYNAHRITGNSGVSNGILKLHIPKPLLDDKQLKIEVGFHDFPIVLERLASETDKIVRSSDEVENNETEFSVTWEGKIEKDASGNIRRDADGNILRNSSEQDTEWGDNFGWMLRSEDISGELKVSETLIVKTDESEFIKLDTDLLSSFYENTKPHFVLFAMQWCQPVWDGIDDPENAIINDQVYVEDAQYANLKMHIVTTYFDIGGSDSYGGKGYGKSETRNSGTYLWRSSGHRGIDLHAELGDNVYAVHAGNVASTSADGTAAGNRITLAFQVNNSSLNIGYLHLDSFVITSGHVMAGKIIAYAGRTGNLGQISRWPGHVHLNIQAIATHRIGLRESLSNLNIGNRNVNVIPSNDYPLLFPCACHVTNNDNPAQCDFNNTGFVSACWAVAELRCPRMNDANRRNRRIQAQLRNLGLYSNLIDGLWGTLPTSTTSTISGTRRGIHDFKRDNNLLVTIVGQTFNPANYDMNENTDDAILNQLAPIEIP